MTLNDLAEIYVDALARHAQLFLPDEAEGYCCAWWCWAGRSLNRQTYEEVRKKRWKAASKIEKLVAKREVPQS